MIIEHETERRHHLHSIKQQKQLFDKELKNRSTHLNSKIHLDKIG